MKCFKLRKIGVRRISVKDLESLKIKIEIARGGYSVKMNLKIFNEKME